VPPSPVQVSVKVALSFKAPVDWVPCRAFVPDQAPEAMQAVALAADQVRVALLPLVILIFGLGPASRIAFGFSHGVLPIIVTTVSGMRAVSPLLLSSARSMGASQGQVLRHIIFPTMVASVFTGLRLAMSLTLLGVILAELFVSTNGIGNYTQIFAETFKPASLYAVILVLAITAVALNEIVGLIELRFSRWKQG